MPQVEIICLACSRKYNQHCVAGLRTDGTGWLRPIGTAQDGSLYPGEITLPDGTLPRLLDVLTLSCSRPQPRPHQPENWLIDGAKWQLVARPAPQALLTIVQAGMAIGPDLLGSVGDRVSYNDFLTRPAQSSLSLVTPENLRWRITLSRRGKRQTRACFTLRGMHYDLAVTDPVWEDRLHALPEGFHAIAAAGWNATDVPIFTVSLSEPFDTDNNGNPFCFKLVAGVMLLRLKAR